MEQLDNLFLNRFDAILPRPIYVNVRGNMAARRLQLLAQREWADGLSCFAVTGTVEMDKSCFFVMVAMAEKNDPDVTIKMADRRL